MGVHLKIRKTKMEGYNTCPFDEMNSNYDGIFLCLKEDFKYFCDPEYLILRKFPSDCKYYPDETLIYNTRYNFIFNHESPGHANLYQTQAWVGGINHYIDNHYEKFIERYERRIANFRNYILSGEHITFLVTGPNIPIYLRNELKSLCKNTIIQFSIEDIEKYQYHMTIMREASLP